MRLTENFKDYSIIDCSEGEKLERWGDIRLIRPDPQIIWATPKDSEWEKYDARYHRSTSGGGSWEMRSLKKREWIISFKGLRFKVSPTGFKHTGLFPEQAVNWELLDEIIRASERPLKVLNLFAYTGGATLACAAAGASVCHVDASKGMVSWARENAKLSGLEDRPIRWIVDDCIKFVEREIRRGNKYDGIIMDPPSYGRGPGGEVWKLEEQIYSLLTICADVLSDNAEFFLLNSYTTGLSASVMEYLLSAVIKPKFGGTVSADEIGIKVEKTGLVLPCGSTAIWRGDN